MKKLFLLVVSAVLLSACGISRRGMAPQGSSQEPERSSDSAPRAMSINRINEIQSSLMQAYRDWEGVPYALGGRSKKGIDCSALVSLVYDDYFDLDLPLSTREQLNVGDGVRRGGVRTGDIVFFRTGRKTFHVGVMINREDFFHASTSSGVMISSLYEPYWADRYFAARRVF